MGFGNYSPKTYFKVANGAIVISIKPGDQDKYSNLLEQARAVIERVDKNQQKKVDICFNFLEGNVTSISQSEAEFNGKKFKTWNIDFVDEEEKQFVWSCGYESYSFQAFLNCLASIEGNIGKIKIGAYTNGKNKTGIVVYHNNEKLSWKYQIEEIPKVIPVMVPDGKGGEVHFHNNGQPVYNNTERMAWVEDLASKMQTKVAFGNETGPVELEECTAEDEINF